MGSSMKEKKANIFTLGIPIFIQLLLFNLLSSVDTIMISDFNENFVISINNASSITSMLNVLLTICSTGVGIVIAQYLGAKKKEDAKKSFGNGLIFNLSLGIILMTILLIFQKPFLQMIQCPKAYINDAMSYVTIIAFGIPFFASYSVIAAELRSHKKTIFITLVAVISNLINVLLNYILIYGKMGFPSLGIKGAAIATLTSNILTFVLSLIIAPIIIKENIYKFSFSFTHLKQILKIGIPSALESFCYTISGLFVTAAVNKLDKYEILARTYINMIMMYIYQFSVAFGQANSILVGYDIGAKKYQSAKKRTYQSYLLCFPILLCLLIILNITGQDIIHLIVHKIDNHDKIIDFAVIVLPWMFVYETGRCINLIFINSLKATGDVVFPLIGAIICMFLFSSFGSWFLGIYLKLGFLGIFLAQALDECVRAVMMIVRWQSNHWMNKSIIK